MDYVMNFIKGASTTAALLVMGSLSCFARPIRMDAKVPVIAVRARRYEFKPSNITLKEGQQVKLVFISDDVTHSLTVKELGLEVNIKKNHSSEVLLTPSKPGNFVGECSIYCGAGHDRMKIVFHVTK
jgi:cytochrome c oxidase subunit II